MDDELTVFSSLKDKRVDKTGDNCISKINMIPSAAELVVNILRFLAAPPEKQKADIDKYLEHCASVGGQPAHIWSPFVEIAEGLLKLPTDAKVMNFQIERQLMIEDVECVLDLIFDRPEGCTIADEQFSTAVEWRVVRRLADLALRGISEEVRPLSVFEILTHVAD